MPFPSRRLAFLLVGAGVALRLATLGHQSLWLDETYSVWLATSHAPAIIWSAGIDPLHPPGYYLLLHWVLAAAGVNEVTARLLSASSSVAGICLVYWLGRVFWPGTTAGRVAAVLLALAPIDVWYAQEARMYSLVAALGCVAALGLFTRLRGAALLLLVGVAGGVTVDHTMWLILALLLGVWTVAWSRAGFRPWPALRVAGVLAAAWVLCRPRLAEAVAVYEALDGVAVFRNAREVLRLPSLTVVAFPWALLTLTLVVAGGSWLCWRAADHPSRRRWMQGLTIAGFLGGTVFASVPRFYGVKQILVSAWPLVTLVAAWAVVDAHRQPEATTEPVRQVPRVVWPVVAVSICALVVMGFTPRADWRGASAFLAETPESVAVIDPAWNRIAYRHYRPADLFVTGPVDNVDTLLAAGTGIREACLIAERFRGVPPTSPSEAWLDGNLPLTRSVRFSRLEVRCYGIRGRDK
jgi:4-amino-4-deoxy-L-arabinose transferase-like glycosyltransferase